MKEQIVNKPALTKITKNLFFSLLVLAIVACMPTGKEKINTDLFKSKEDLKVRAAELKPGMNTDSVFKKLSIPMEKFSFMSTQEVQMNIYGNSMVQGTPEQLENFKRKLLTYKGYSLPYRDINSDSSLGFGKMQLNKNGHDLRLVLIFEKDKLLRASVDGTQNVNMNEDQYMWSSIIKKSTGFGF